MDPDACLDELLEAAATQELDRYQELTDALYGWLGAGGFRPNLHRIMRFRVRWDYGKAQPHALATVLGARNEGFTVEAVSLEAAKATVRTQYRLNPFYLSFTQER